MFFSSYSFYCLEKRKQTKNVLMKCEMLYTDEYYTHEYIKEMTRFRAEEKLVVYDRRIRKTGLINEFI